MALFDQSKLSSALLPLNEIKWFIDVPEEKRIISDTVKARLKALAERWLTYTHAPYGDSYGEFKRNRNRCNFEDLYINRRVALADMAFYEIFAGGDRYIPEIERLVRMICEEDTWCVPAHAGIKSPETTGHVIELYASETCSVLAFTCYFLKNKLPTELAKTVKNRITERMFIPYTETDGYKWMGAQGQKVNNWNPWINSNVLFCAATVCEDEEEYKKLALRACSLTENYINSLSDDCLPDEGVRYWHLSGACLFDFSELVYDLTGGEVDVTRSHQVRSACGYMTGMYDEYGQPANFADATIEFYPDWALLTRAGERTENDLLRDMGRSLYNVDTFRYLHDNFYRQLKNVYTASGIQPIDRKDVAYPKSTLLKGINICTLRDNGFFVCFKGNHNGESHNHNDVGSFVVYKDGTPVFIDPGVDLYSGFTFSEWRTKLWYMRSEYHSVPVIGGKPQQCGAKFAATPMLVDGTKAECEISGAYGEGTPKWNRAVEITDGAVIVTDRFTVTEGTELHYMLRDLPTVEGNTLRFPCGVTATLEGVTDIRLEEFDITGENPPDGIRGDAENRHTDGFSVLIPRLFIKQWKKTTLVRLICTPIKEKITLKIST